MSAASPPPRRGVRRFFLMGLAGVLPFLLTAVVVVWAFRLVDDQIGRPLSVAIERAVHPEPPAHGPEWRPWTESSPFLYGTVRPFAAFLLFFLAIVSLGFLLARRLGRRAHGRIEGLLGRFPLLKAIYPYAKQFVDFFLGERTRTFHGVVAVPYPRPGCYCLGLVTGEAVPAFEGAAGPIGVRLFVPNSPNPLSGYIHFVDRSELVALDLPVEEVFRMVMTGGVLHAAAAAAGEPSAAEGVARG